MKLEVLEPKLQILYADHETKTFSNQDKPNDYWGAQIKINTPHFNNGAWMNQTIITKAFTGRVISTKNYIHDINKHSYPVIMQNGVQITNTQFYSYLLSNATKRLLIVTKDDDTFICPLFENDIAFETIEELENYIDRMINGFYTVEFSVEKVISQKHHTL